MSLDEQVEKARIPLSRRPMSRRLFVSGAAATVAGLLAAATVGCGQEPKPDPADTATGTAVDTSTTGAATGTSPPGTAPPGTEVPETATSAPATPIVNPVTAYENQLPLNVYKSLLPLGADGKLSQESQALIDFALHVGDGLIPPQYRDDFPHNYSDAYFEDLQFQLVIDVIGVSNSVSPDQAAAMQALTGRDRWWITRDYILQDLLREDILSRDSDGDGITNLDSILQDVNALEPLETDPTNRSERHIYIVNGYQYGYPINQAVSPGDALDAYLTARMNGYDDDHIHFVYQDWWLEDSSVVTSPWGPFEVSKNLKTDFVDPLYDEYGKPTPSSALAVLGSIRSKDNDQLTLYFIGHGHKEPDGKTGYFSLTPDIGGYSSSLLSDTLNVVPRGRMILTTPQSFGGAFIKGMAHNVIGHAIYVSQNNADQSTNSSIGWNGYLIKDLSEGKSVLQAGAALPRKIVDVYRDGILVGSSSNETNPRGDLSLAETANPFHYLRGVSQ